eukprot:1038081-Amphidinium_carterae.1
MSLPQTQPPHSDVDHLVCECLEYCWSLWVDAGSNGQESSLCVQTKSFFTLTTTLVRERITAEILRYFTTLSKPALHLILLDELSRGT